MFEELQAVCRLQGSDRCNPNTPNWIASAPSANEDGGGDDDINEDERTWRDPSAHKLRSAVGKWMRDDHQRRLIIHVSYYVHMNEDSVLIHICFFLGPSLEGTFRSQFL
jgi:U3 small nucleolar RNA-associated protein 20